MTALPAGVTGNNLDQDTDDVFQARAELNAAMASINTIINYLGGLFGFEGTKSAAIATLFENQAVIFPAGTRMVFVQAAVPPGWTLWVWGDGVRRYLLLCDDTGGGQNTGDFNVNLQSTATQLLIQHMPNVLLGGYTDFQGNHAHVYPRLFISNNDPGVANVRLGEVAGNVPHEYVWVASGTTNAGGNHQHNVTVSLGGGNGPHDHFVNMSNYRPRAWTAQVGIKA